MKILINTHYCSREELKTLLNYLKRECWDHRIIGKEVKNEEDNNKSNRN